MPTHPKAAEKTNPNSASQKQRTHASSLQQMAETWHQPGRQSQKPRARGCTFPTIKLLNISPAQIRPPKLLISFETCPAEARVKVSVQLEIIARRSMSTALHLRL